MVGEQRVSTLGGGSKVIVLLGPPGGGKGTQAKMLAATFGLEHISTGDLLREEISHGTPLGVQVKEIMAHGDLIPDDLVGEIVRNRLARIGEQGVILDGYPRTLTQARFLKTITRDMGVCAINIEVDEHQIVKRLAGRRFCSECGNIYNIYFSPPQRSSLCDACGGKLLRRPDDNEEVIAERLKVYREQTRPVIDFYKKCGNYHEVDGNWDADEGNIAWGRRSSSCRRCTNRRRYASRRS